MIDAQSEQEHQYDVIVLAGGRATRFPGKLAHVMPSGHSLLAEVLHGVTGTGHVLVVGPTTDTDIAVEWIDEPEPFGGPLSGISAALPRTRAEVIVVLAGDAPNGPAAIPALLSALAVSDDVMAACIVDSEGRRQPLTAAYRRAHLIDACAGDTRDRPARQLLDTVVVEVPDRWGASHDIDTPSDLA